MSTLHKSSPSVQDQYAFQSISKKSEKSFSSNTVLEIMESCDMVVLNDKRAADFAGYHESAKNYTVLEFNLSGNAVPLKGLFNGIISLGNPKEVSLTHQKELGSYILKFYDKDEKTAVAYFSKIISIIEDEIRFKTILHKVIENLKAFDTSQQLLKKELSQQ